MSEVGCTGLTGVCFLRTFRLYSLAYNTLCIIHVGRCFHKETCSLPYFSQYMELLVYRPTFDRDMQFSVNSMTRKQQHKHDYVALATGIWCQGDFREWWGL